MAATRSIASSSPSASPREGQSYTADVARGTHRELVLSSRTVAAVLLLFLLLGLASRALPQNLGITAATTMVLATVAIGVVPGALLLLGVWPHRKMSGLELFGLGIALSFAVVGLLTLAVVVLHGSANAALIALFAGSALLAVPALIRLVPDRRVVCGRPEAVVGLPLVLVAIVLYVEGGQAFAGEDQIHISVIRRLAAIPSIRLDNFYLSPGVIYTYPIPATHFFFSLVSNIGGIDPLFVYQKLRFFWAVSSILTLYLAARLLVSSELAAITVAVTGILLAITGSLGTVPGYFWGQLLPVSHASDVAMNVMLPGLIVLTLYFLRSRGKTQTAILFGLVAGPVFLLSLVHSREIVQLVVYLGSFILATAILRPWGKRRQIARAVVLLGVTLVFLALYSHWQRTVSASIGLLEDTRKQGMQGIMSALSPFTGGRLHIPLDVWLRPPLSAENTIPGTLAYGWNPIGIALGPILLLMLRRNVALLFVAGSVVVYFLIIRVLVLNVTFTYFTYSEVLSTPVRNVVFFAYIAIGAALYLAADWLARIPWLILSVFAAVVLSVALSFIYAASGSFVQQHTDALLFGVPICYGIAFVFYRYKRLARWATRVLPRRPLAGWYWTYLCLIVPLAVLTRVPDSVPLGLGNITSPTFTQNLHAKLEVTPANMLDNLQCCAPSAPLQRWALENLPIDAVIAWDAQNPYLLTTFLPQQVPAPTGSAGDAVFLQYVTPDYYAIAQRAKQEGRTQPFFDAAESPDERAEYLRALHITHVVLDPQVYPVMQPILVADRETYEPTYDDGKGWAVFRVRPG